MRAMRTGTEIARSEPLSVETRQNGMPSHDSRSVGGASAWYLRYSGSATVRFSAASRSIITFAVLAACIALTYLCSALSAPPNIDDRAWVDRSLQPLYAPRLEGNYYYAVHHPSFMRLVYSVVLHRMGVYEVRRPLVSYNKDRDWNIEHGAWIPYEIGMPLRYVNVAFLSGMIALLYFAFKRMFRNRALALIACIPILWNPPVRDGVCIYIGCDSALLFWLAAFWFVWLVTDRRGAGGVIALAAVGGVLASTKINGAFALAGAVLYYALSSKGARRIIYPAALIAIPAAVFLAMNPIYRAGNVNWTISVVRNMLRIMFNLKEATSTVEWAHFTKLEILREAFPYWFFAVPILAVFTTARSEKWFRPTVAWAAATAGLNWVLIYVPMLRYDAPISMSFLVLFDASAIFFLAELLKRTVGSGTQAAPAAEGTR